MSRPDCGGARRFPVKSLIRIAYQEAALVLTRGSGGEARSCYGEHLQQITDWYRPGGRQQRERLRCLRPPEGLKNPAEVTRHASRPDSFGVPLVCNLPNTPPTALISADEPRS